MILAINYDIVTVLSLLLNLYLIFRPREQMYDFGKATAIALRLAESKYLSASDKVSILAADLNNIDWAKVEHWKREGLRDKVNEVLKV